MKQKGFIYGGILAVIILLLMAGNLFLGAVSIPASAVCDILTGNEVEKASWSFIVWESRFPQCITALLCGAALSVSGLMLQTVFSNLLADPSILGISSGASLGVALVMLAGGGTIVTGAFTLSGFLSVIVGAFAGASVVMGLILFLSTLIRNSVMLLIAGIMIGYITSSAISLLNFFATAEGVHSYMIWGLGNFGGVSLQQLPVFSAVTLLGLFTAVLLIKPLNALLLGPRYAENLGVNIRRIRNLLLIATGCLYRPGSSSYRPADAGYFQPQFAAACHSAHRKRHGLALQSDLRPAGRSRYHSPECRDSDSRGTGHYLCYHQPTQTLLMNHSTPIIEGCDLSIGYRSGKQVKTVHRHLNFSLHRGELTCLLGANGAGKSTLLRTLAATQMPLEGSLKLLGRPIASYSERERSRTIGVVLTDKTQAGGLTVYELVALGRQPHTGFFGRLHARDHEVIRHALQAVGITHKAQTYTSELSDGERQKAMIAKALVQECPLILLDEPTAFLDVTSRIETMNLLHRLAVEEQKAILLSTHDIEQALILADRLWLLTREGGLECGVTEDLILHNRMDSLFPQNKNIRFDLMHGGYSPIVSGQKSVCLQADDEMLRHWAQNALNRNNCFCLSEPSDDYPTVRITSPENILLTTSQGTHTCTSFDELLQNI
mgnify:CR=1 FL=1